MFLVKDHLIFFLNQTILRLAKLDYINLFIQMNCHSANSNVFATLVPLTLHNSHEVNQWLKQKCYTGTI